MKFDYKPKAAQMRSPILKRTLHVSLGFMAFVCLVILFSNSKPSSTMDGSIASVTLPVVVPTPLAGSEISAATSLESKPDLKAEAKVAAPSKRNALHLKPEENLPEAMQEEVAVVAEATETENDPVENMQVIKIREGDTLTKIFARLGIPTKDVHEIMEADPAARGLRSLRPGQVLNVQIDAQQQLAALTLDLAPGSTLYITRQENGFQVEHKLAPLEKQIAFGKGEIQNSLFSSGKRAGLDQNILAQMVEIFGWNIDFGLDLQPNDTFRVLYEEKCLDGERIQTGHILAAEIINGGTKHQAVRYTDKSGQTGYFSPEGYGMHQAFLRTPVNFTRISSHFGHRRHPILHHMRHHNGVDYSAPHGTPVQATGDGKVVFAGKRSGYGNVVELQHGARYSTLYAHLSKFPKGMRVGAEVAQGQVIGFVGRTGLATGDHLHYEFRVDGIHRDPLTAMPKKNPIAERNKRHFIAHAKEMIRLLDLHENKINMARAEYPVNE